MKSFRFHPEAQIELVASAKYYEAEQDGLGERFLEEVYESIRHVCLFPSSYQQIESGVRRCCVDHFPFGIVFRERDSQMEIIAIIHFKRHPDYWKNRV